MTSLQNHVDEVYVTDSVLLEKDDANGKTLLLVEGQDDEYVYKKLTCWEKCKVAKEDGDNNIVEAIKKHNKYNKKGILAIKDSHFDNIMARTLPPNVLTTDGYDLEVMILSTQALEDFAGSRLIGKDENRVEEFKSVLRDRLFELGGLFGYLRFKSRQCPWEDRINVHQVLQLLDSSCEVSLNDVIKILKELILNLDETQFSQIELDELTKTFLPDLCRGHDMVLILSKIFVQLSSIHFGKKTQPGKHLANQLFATFNSRHFESTDLHKKIESWQEDNEPYSVLPVG